MQQKKRILLLATGGTIASRKSDNGLKPQITPEELIEYIPQVKEICDVEAVQLLNLDSTNMEPSHWKLMVHAIWEHYDDFDGFVIAHGTDTLAYTASLLALALSKVEIPVFLVSSQLPLNQEGANGNENFRRSVELICAGIHSGVYVVYRNEDGRCFLHHGGHLVSSGDYSNDFYSRDAVCLGEVSKVMEGECSRAAMHLNQWTEELKRDKICSQRNGNGIDLSRMGELKSDVLCIEPYVGLNYQQIVLNKEIRAVIHGLYHSATACIGGTNEEQKSEYSMLPFLMRCREARIPVIVTPCPNEAAYASGVWMMEAGAVPVYGMTKEMVYVKTLLAGVLGYPNEKLCSFLKEDVCGE